MAVTDGLRTVLDAVAPQTSDRLDESRFLLAGATAGLLGWGGTQLLAWTDPPSAALLATALWVVLLAAFSGLTVLHGPAEARFSDVLFIWGAVNSTAMAMTVAALVGVVPERLGFWTAWAGASTLGYAGTGALLVRAGVTDRGWGYLAAAVVGLGVLLLGTVSFGALAPVAFLVLAALHAVPLVLDARTALSPLGRGSLLAAVIGVLVGVGLLA